MKHFKFIPAALVTACLIGGCGSSSSTATTGTKAPPVAPAEVKPGDEATLFPIAVGNQWTFDEQEAIVAGNGQRRTGQAEVTLRISKVSDANGGKQVTLDVLTGGKLTNRQGWLLTKDGLFQNQTGLKLDPVKPPQPIAKFPIKEGEVTKWAGVGTFGDDHQAKQTSELTTKGSRLVDTDMGQVSAILFQSVSTIQTTKTKGTTEMSLWLRPGTGIAKIEQKIMFAAGRQIIELTLKNFTPKAP